MPWHKASAPDEVNYMYIRDNCMFRPGVSKLCTDVSLSTNKNLYSAKSEKKESERIWKACFVNFLARNSIY